MLGAARDFMNELSADQRNRVLYAFDNEERFNWNYVPVKRNGVPFREMSPAQRASAHRLLRSALSDSGYQKAVDIMVLEGILGQIESQASSRFQRDPDGYFLTLFGDIASGTEPWGWRIDGHHLSLTVSVGAERKVASTPAFWGANPARVPSGERKGWRVLRDEEDLARGLLNALPEDLQAEVRIADEAPSDILTRNCKVARIGDPAGLPVSAMAPAQKEAVIRILELYAANLRTDLGEAHLSRIRKAGVDRLHFAWAGGVRPGEKHYYRIHGPTHLVEYDNTQNDANHIHSVLRDLEDDFGLDPLRKHYADCEHDA
ncbi:MAG: DUF3500 domain-containing protein [Candidatus Latescibacteria bacterium]|nr:DUF3500 domain-containing protein [Candidatus Latescibacterota bacterium]